MIVSLISSNTRLVNCVSVNFPCRHQLQLKQGQVFFMNSESCLVCSLVLWVSGCLSFFYSRSLFVGVCQLLSGTWTGRLMALSRWNYCRCIHILPSLLALFASPMPRKLCIFWTSFVPYGSAMAFAHFGATYLCFWLRQIGWWLLEETTMFEWMDTWMNKWTHGKFRPNIWYWYCS